MDEQVRTLAAALAQASDPRAARASASVGCPVPVDCGRVAENGLHWIRDVVFAEDDATTHTAHGPQAFAALRNRAVSLPHRWRHRHITAARQFYASHPAALFRRLASTPARL